MYISILRKCRVFLSDYRVNISAPSTNLFRSKPEDTAEETKCLYLNSHPEVVYQAIQSVFFGALAITTVRFKYLWIPHMCLFAAGIFCNQAFWKAALNKVGIKQIYVSIFTRCCRNSIRPRES